MVVVDHILLSICLLTGIFYLFINHVRGSRETRKVPGPKPLPLLGNVFDMPTNTPWLIFDQWRKIYGDIFGLSAFGKRFLVVNNRQALETLLVERGSNYSGRPAMTLMRECLGFNWTGALLPHGEEMVRQRRMMAQCIGTSPHRSYFPDIRLSILNMCIQIHDNPSDWLGALKLMVIKNIARISYGFDIKDFSDEYVITAEALNKATHDMGSLGSHPIDLFPILSYLPDWIWGKKFVKHANILREYTSKMFNVPYLRARRNIAQGTSIPKSMVETLIAANLQDDGRSIANEFSIKGMTATAYTAGVDTTTSSLQSFVLLMMCNPEIQARAQRAVDATFEGDRLPEFSDRGRKDLVYIEALVMEIYRWASIVPLAMPHRLVEDDVYDGYPIKCGTIIIPNTWACLHEPSTYPEPMAFKPERFLEPDPACPDHLRLRKDVPDPRTMAFGYGRRVCPGRFLADSVIWFSITTLLCLFDFSKAPDPTRPGEVIEPDLEYNTAIAISSPKAFECIVGKRSKIAFEVLQRSTEE